MTKKTIQYFYSSFLFAFFSIIGAALIGFYYSNSAEGALNSAFLAFILGILEVSISFDNAVVNASVLKKMNAVWQARFMTWGMIVAVFGMRLVFPLLIVSIAVQANPWAALSLAIWQPAEYAKVMLSVHHEVSAFGGAFLMLVALKYFFDYEKEIHWLHVIEKPLAKMGHLESIGVGITLIVLIFLSLQVPPTEQVPILYSGIGGILAYLAVQAVESFLGEAGGGVRQVVRSSVGTFLYLEVLDASFSFDGVVGAFAITNNLFIIALGLGIGAMFVRSLTLFMVEKNTLKSFAFLEHGAFYAVLSLSIMMFLGTIYHIHEAATAVVSALFIFLSIWASFLEKKKN